MDNLAKAVQELAAVVAGLQKEKMQLRQATRGKRVAEKRQSSLLRLGLGLGASKEAMYDTSLALKRENRKLDQETRLDHSSKYGC